MHRFTTIVKTILLRICPIKKQEGNDGPVSLHLLIRKIPSYQTLKYLGIGLKHKTLRRTKIGKYEF